MEHRHHIRKPLRIDVEVFNRGQFLGRFETRDVNAGGLFVETGPLTLRRNAMMTLTFDLDREANAGVHNLLAMVVHQSREGVGLMFHDVDRGSLQMRNALLDAAA